jgi:hypothetical protein
VSKSWPLLQHERLEFGGPLQGFVEVLDDAVDVRLDDVGLQFLGDHGNGGAAEAEQVEALADSRSVEAELLAQLISHLVAED